MTANIHGDNYLLMRRNGSRNIGIILILLGITFAVILVLFPTWVLQKGDYLTVSNSENEAEILIVYPFNNTLFPPEIAAPSFRWNINRPGINNWFVQFSTSGNNIYSAYVFETIYKPDSLVWEKIKVKAKSEKITFSIFCQIKKDSSEFRLSANTNFQFSPDKVGAPLFFRNLDLPFSFINQHLSSIEWCLGDISNYKRAKTLLTGMNICGNCHSFSADGKVMGIDFDYLNDKGGYASFGISGETKIGKGDFFSWNNMSSNGNSSSGFLSVVSPNGRYVVSTINDISVKSFIDPEFRFFPIKGVLGIFDRVTRESYELNGANDTMFVQSNATWSPDGETLIFAKAPVLGERELNDAKTMNELAAGSKEFTFDLWSIPFNKGKGGEAKPLIGASANGKSNYFPKVSPDGKWIVFAQSHSYMLRQLDSKLFIVPFNGGEARELECNLSVMNSWHSWSPNSKWIAFSTKGFSPYTKIALTHIDENGHASPPVFLENLISDTKVANLPEFVNIGFQQWNSINLDFLTPLSISTLDLNNIRDGVFMGKATLNDYHLNEVSANLKIVVAKGKISEINIQGSHGISEISEGILDKIIKLQSIDLVQLGYTSTEELVLIKAVEDGLMKGTI